MGKCLPFSLPPFFARLLVHRSPTIFARLYWPRAWHRLIGHNCDVLRWCYTCARNNSQWWFLAQHSAAMLEWCCNHSKQCRNNFATLCCTKNHCCGLCHETLPLTKLSYPHKMPVCHVYFALTFWSEQIRMWDILIVWCVVICSWFCKL